MTQQSSDVTNDDRDAHVADLLHDADRAEGGAWLAKSIGDSTSALELQAKHAALLDEALRLDPNREAPGWDECEYCR
jgi:hypothetical protein